MFGIIVFGGMLIFLVVYLVANHRQTKRIEKWENEIKTFHEVEEERRLELLESRSKQSRKNKDND